MSMFQLFPMYVCRFLKLSLDEKKVRSAETPSVIQSVASNPAGRVLSWRFVRANWDILYGRYFGGDIRWLVLLSLTDLCYSLFVNIFWQFCWCQSFLTNSILVFLFPHSVLICFLLSFFYPNSICLGNSLLPPPAYAWTEGARMVYSRGKTTVKSIPYLVMRHRKFHQYFREFSPKNFALKIESLRNFPKYSKFGEKL